MIKKSQNFWKLKNKRNVCKNKIIFYDMLEKNEIILKNVGKTSFCKENKEGEGKLKISPRLNGNDRN